MMLLVRRSFSAVLHVAILHLVLLSEEQAGQG